MRFLRVHETSGCGWVLVSVNIGVLLSEKLLPTQGLRQVFSERRESEGEEGGTQTHTHTHPQKEQPQMPTPSHVHADTQADMQTNVDEVSEPSCSQ